MEPIKTKDMELEEYLTKDNNIVICDLMDKMLKLSFPLMQNIDIEVNDTMINIKFNKCFYTEKQVKNRLNELLEEFKKWKQ